MFGAPEEIIVNPLIIVHAGAAVLSLLLGLWVMVMRKGTKNHKYLGNMWTQLMMVTAATSFGIGESLSYIHILSFITITTIPLSLLAAHLRMKKVHAFGMIANYIGLWSAAIPAFLTEGRLMNFLFFV
ncbi:MAG: hypothetical protein N0C84_01425 [Candidatus Thiodiazotropha taylori]|uniref:DUF2306 domain-containing protein n=1 Tax=Candidatus Thiodiazotropha taylori TaxID=2792791 RepID=A0A9E4K9S2_9GAMM|nr:hypothetical protein [Candidatus Thiodiazotropha taylori]MCW4255108.1 hypothetical protein [Candidatus Thiodiazotropha taylori]